MDMPLYIYRRYNPGWQISTYISMIGKYKELGGVELAKLSLSRKTFISILLLLQFWLISDSEKFSFMDKIVRSNAECLMTNFHQFCLANCEVNKSR